MDEAAAKLRMERDSVPEELDEIIRKRAQLEIERESIRRESTAVSGSPTDNKLQLLDQQIAELREQETQMRAQWESEKSLSDKYQKKKEELEQLTFEADKAEREGNYGRVAEIRYGLIQQIQAEMKELQTKMDASPAGRLGGVSVTADDIAEVVSRWTGIPVTRMMQSEREKLLHLEEELHKRVIGQNEAITLYRTP